MRRASRTPLLLALACACGPEGAPTTATETTAGASSTSGATGEAATWASAAPTSGETSVGTSVGTSAGTSAGSDLGGAGECSYALTPVPGLEFERAVAGDYDGDGVLDLALALGGEVQIRRGAGDGVTFTAQGGLHPVGGAPLAGGDFNGDGAPDLVVYDIFPIDGVRVLPNVGGDFGLAIETPMEALFYTLQVADVDGDGDDDLSEGGLYGMPVRVYHAELGIFTEVAQLEVPACYATASAWADYDGDGDLDVAVIGDCNAILGAPFVAVHLREGEGYAAILDAAQAESADTFALVAGDFDGDQAIDIVTHGGRQEPAFELHRGHGDGTFAVRQAFPVGVQARVTRALDLDGDGLDDVLSHGDGVVLHRGTPEGFAPCALGPGMILAVGDFDGDSVQDVLLGEGPEVLIARAGG